MTDHLQRLRRHLMRAERTATENKTVRILTEETSH
jgi:hypothetical protein